MNPAISVSQLSKIYKLYPGPRALFTELFFGKPSHHPLKALQNLDFEVAEGEAFGVVGSNGAGKSTLLKIITGTAFPTSGNAVVNGTVSALLELGAGFHPEFTGRENIYFNGAVMGLSRAQVEKRENEIIEFSELGSFIDEPVKTYSSGMYLRLGFSVATGFDSSILIIDEALAVGDQRFQKKCTDRIADFRKAGKTILFCSHNLHQVKALCDRAIWLMEGRVKNLGEAGHVVDEYNSWAREPVSEESHPASARDSELCWIDSVRLLDEECVQRHQFGSHEGFQLEVEASFSEGFDGTPGVGVSLVRSDGVIVYTTSTIMGKTPLTPLGGNRYMAAIAFDSGQLLAGSYYFNVFATDDRHLQAYSIQEKVEPFTVTDLSQEIGIVRLKHRWK
jgi:ABC-type polysaccharide/polyol phosphate transport system ATPase subunit